jgi:seryl-tRNA synthetase
MLDLGYVRANLELVKKKLGDRGMDPAVALGQFDYKDRLRRESITALEQLQADRNTRSADIAQKKRNGVNAEHEFFELGQLKSAIQAKESIARIYELELSNILAGLPNLPQDSVPIGPDERSNHVEKVWDDGEKLTGEGQPDTAYTPAAPAFPALPHWEIGERLGILDFERAAKISGSRFVVHYGQGARLERALANFMLDLHTREHGYTEVLPPYMVNSKSLFGTGQLPKFAEDLFHCDDKGAFEPGKFQDGDHWLIPTAEVPVTNLFRDETLDESQLTTSFCAYTPCFRSEAGS